MTSAVQRYSFSNPPPTVGALDGRETVHEAEILELQALQAQRNGEGGRGVLLMERALQIRSQVVAQLRESWANATQNSGDPHKDYTHHMTAAPKTDPTNLEELLSDYQRQTSDLYDAAERLAVICNTLGVEHFKRDAFEEASPLLEYALQLTEDSSYPLCEVEDRRQHLRGVTLNNLGCMERRRGHFSEALQYMKSSMEMTGVESPVAYMNISAILIQLRLSEEAVRMAERSIELLYQTPEDPSLLSVAHHNLAMALEPVDASRCLEEYALAYRTACATLGAESETSRAIQRSWQRYEATRAPSAMGRLFNNGSTAVAAAVSRLRGFVGIAPTANTGALPTPRTPSPSTSQRANQTSGMATVPADVMELFPHPYLPSMTAPAALTRPPRDVTPMYHPAAVPRRPLVPKPPPPPPQSGASAASAKRSQYRQPSPPKKSVNAQPPLRSRGAEKIPRRPPSPTRSAATAVPRQIRTTRPSGYVAATTPSPPSQRQATGASRLSRSVPRVQEATQRSSPLTSTHRQAPSDIRSNSGMIEKRGRSATRDTSDRSQVAVASTTAVSVAFISGSQTATRPLQHLAKVEGGIGASSSLFSQQPPPPRNLPPLQAYSTPVPAAEEVQTSLSARSSRVLLGAGDPILSSSAFPSFDADPLTFLQNRLEILLQDENELDAKYAHATAIQRLFRGHLARRRVAALRVRLAKGSRLAEIRRNIAARRIQRLYHRYRRQIRYPLAAKQSGRYGNSAGRRGAQHQAATKLQRIARGWLARRLYAKMRKYKQDSPAAATRIQRWIRTVQARRQFAALRAEKARLEAMAREHERRQYAATRIQGQWRTHVQRRKCHVALRNAMMERAAADARRRMRSAITIQSAWRGYQARRFYQGAFAHMSRLRAARLEYEKRRQAAVRLQSFGRMLIAKHHSLSLLTTARFRAAAEIQTRGREGRAATIIQCAYRSHVARRVCAVKRTTRARQQRQELQRARAATLQRAGRGYLARRGVGKTLSAFQAEAQLYEQRLQALREQDAKAARAAQQAREQKMELLRSEEDERNLLHQAEWRDRTFFNGQHEASAKATSKLEAYAQPARNVPNRPLIGFTRIVKAKWQRSKLQQAREAYLHRCIAQNDDAWKESSALVVTNFMRRAAARQLMLSRAKTMSSYTEARVMQEEKLRTEAVGDAAVKPGRPLTAEQIEVERKALDRLEHVEKIASEDRPAAAARRPLTAEQIEAERAALNRLEHAEAVASEDRPAAAARRPLTAEQIEAERAALNRLEHAEAVASEDRPAAAARRPLTAEQIEAERAALNRLEHAEAVASEDRPAAAARRPLTAEQIEGERAALNRLEHAEAVASVSVAVELEDSQAADQTQMEVARKGSLVIAESHRGCISGIDAAEFEEDSAPLCSSPHERTSTPDIEATMLNNLKGIWQAEEAAEKERRQRREILKQAAFDYKQKLIATAVAKEDLAPYRLSRVRIEKPRLDALQQTRKPSEEALTAEKMKQHQLDRQKRELAAVRCIERFILGKYARRYLAALQKVRDQYLKALQEYQCCDGPALSLTQLAEVRAQYPGLERKYPPEETARAEAVLMFRPILKGFTRIVKAKWQRSKLQQARDAYLDRCIAQNDDAWKESSALVVTNFMRQAAARQLMLNRAKTMSSYTEARVMQEEKLRTEAAGDAAAKPGRPLTAEQIEAERKALDRLEHVEKIASEDRPAAAARRPLTAEQIEAERAALNRLEHAEAVVSRGPSADVQLPLTAEQIAAEEAKVITLEDDEETLLDDTLRSTSVCKFPDEQIVAVERLALHQIESFDVVNSEEEEARDFDSLKRRFLNANSLREQREMEAWRQYDAATFSPPSPSPRMSMLRDSRPNSGDVRGRFWVFSRRVNGESSLLPSEVQHCAASPSARYEDEDGHGASTAASHQMKLSTSAGVSSQVDVSKRDFTSDVSVVDQDAMHELYMSERRSFATSLLKGFVRIIKAKQQHRKLQEARESYLDRCATEDSMAREKESARVVMNFMRAATARCRVHARAEALAAYNEDRLRKEEALKSDTIAERSEVSHNDARVPLQAPQQEHRLSNAACIIQRFFRIVHAKRILASIGDAHRAHLDMELAVEELLHSAALRIQCLFRGHLARRQAAMAIVRRDLYLLSVQESQEEIRNMKEVGNAGDVASSASFTSMPTVKPAASTPLIDAAASIISISATTSGSTHSPTALPPSGGSQRSSGSDSSAVVTEVLEGDEEF